MARPSRNCLLRLLSYLALGAILVEPLHAQTGYDPYDYCAGPLSTNQQFESPLHRLFEKRALWDGAPKPKLFLDVVSAETGAPITEFCVNGVLIDGRLRDERVYCGARRLPASGPAPKPGPRFAGYYELGGTQLLHVTHPDSLPWLHDLRAPLEEPTQQPLTIRVELQARRGHVVGRFIDSVNKRPLVNARVLVQREIVERTNSKPMSLWTRPSIESTTDEEGRFRLEVQAAPGYQPVIVASQPGYFPVPLTLQEPSQELGTMEMEPHSFLDVRLTDDAGRPLPERFVYVLHDDVPHLHRDIVVGLASEWGQKLAQRYQTYADGSFRTEPVRSGTWRIVYGPPDHDVVSIQIEAGETQQIDIEVQATP